MMQRCNNGILMIKLNECHFTLDIYKAQGIVSNGNIHTHLFYTMQSNAHSIASIAPTQEKINFSQCLQNGKYILKTKKVEKNK